ncbi:MAG TPA: hypothetical protein PLJ60_05230 [Chryseolinea sp.]|nr:hypothetical protein [Chryseolinea sp.]HPM29721.1 hypothetical protein [Chryseolinea sp.]
MRTVIVGFLFFISCSGQRDKGNKDIAQLRKELPKIATPIEFNSERMLKYKSVELEGNGLINELKAKNYFTLLGKVFETENNITIIGYIPDDIGTPILITFDNNGNQISSHAIYETAMGDMGRYTVNIVTILPDRQILFIDSTVTRKINAEGTDEIAGSDSVSVTNRKYQITAKGMIEVVE